MNCPNPNCTGVLETYFLAGETDFKLCGTCGLVIRQPLPTPAELDAIYAGLYQAENISSGKTNQESNPYAVSVYSEFLRKELLRRGDTVLDFGAGSGALVESLRKQGIRCDGVEASMPAREYCNKTRGIALQADLVQCKERSYDLVTMIEVIEHLEEPWLILEQVRRVLKPGGRLFVTTPNREGFRAKLEKGYWNEATKKFHLTLFNRATMSGLLENAKYRQIKWVRFSPVQKREIKYQVVGRCFQVLGLQGTLCMIAEAE